MRLLIWLIEKAVECALGTALVAAYFAINSQFARLLTVPELLGEYWQLYEGLFMAFYVTLGYGLTSAVLNALLYRRNKPISMAWRAGLNLLVFSLSFGIAIALLAAVMFDGAVVPKASRDTSLIYHAGLILYPIGLMIVALTTYTGQKARDRFAPKA